MLVSVGLLCSLALRKYPGTIGIRCTQSDAIPSLHPAAISQIIKNTNNNKIIYDILHYLWFYLKKKKMHVVFCFVFGSNTYKVKKAIYLTSKSCRIMMRHLRFVLRDFLGVSLLLFVHRNCVLGERKEKEDWELLVGLASGFVVHLTARLADKRVNLSEIARRFVCLRSSAYSTDIIYPNATVFSSVCGSETGNSFLNFPAPLRRCWTRIQFCWALL